MRTLLFLIVVAFACEAGAQTITFTAEEYPPYTFRDGKDYRGAVVEQVQDIMKEVGIEYTMEFMPWARAFALAQSQPMHCVFTTAHSADRDRLFKWVEPLLQDQNVLVARRDSTIRPVSLKEARLYTIGVQRDDYAEKILREMGFPKLDLATDFNLTLGKLLNGRIDLMPIAEGLYSKLRKEGFEIEATVPLPKQIFAIACQKDFPDALIGRMQAALDRLIADGRQKQLFLKYHLAPMQ